MVVAVSAAAGPSIAGSILALGSWHWLFVINIPLGLAALVIGHRFLPHNPTSDTKHKFDKISAIANALTFGLLIYTLEGFAHAENRKFIAIQLVLLIHNRHLFHPPPTEGNDPYPTCGLTEDSYFRSFYRYFHHLIHRPDAGYGFLTVFYAEYIGIQRRTDRFATYPLAIGYHPDRTICRQTGRESTSRIAGRHRHGHLRYRPIHTLFASPHPAEWNIIWRMGTLWYGLRAVPDAQ